MSGLDIRVCNVLITEGVDDWKVVALFAISGHSKCHGPNLFGIRINRVDNRNIMALWVSGRHWNVMILVL